MSYNKVIKHAGSSWNIKVEMNYEAERHINGKVTHKITANCTGFDNYYKTYMAEDSLLVEVIEKSVSDIENYCRDKDSISNSMDKRLQTLGFK